QGEHDTRFTCIWKIVLTANSRVTLGERLVSLAPWPWMAFRQVRDRARPADLPRCLPQAPLHRAVGRLLRMEGDQGAEGETAVRDRHKGWRTVRHRRHLGELERAGFGRMDSHVCNHHDRCQ